MTPATGSGYDIATTLIDFLGESKVDVSALVAVGCDGTAVNTGKTNGAIACMEVLLNIEVQHLICLLHTNELPLRHLMNMVDGQTTGPSTFSGPIGKKLGDCEKLPTIAFEPIPATWVSEIQKTNDLSTDQKYLFEICDAV